MKSQYYGLISVIIVLVELNLGITQQKAPVSKVVIFQSKKHPKRKVTLNLPALVFAKLSKNTKRREYILQGGKDSNLTFIPVKIKPFLKLALDTSHITVPFNAIQDMAREDLKSWDLQTFMGLVDIGLGLTAFYFIADYQYTKNGSPESVSKALEGYLAYLAITVPYFYFYRQKNITPEKWKIAFEEIDSTIPQKIGFYKVVEKIKKDTIKPTEKPVAKPTRWAIRQMMDTIIDSTEFWYIPKKHFKKLPHVREVHDTTSIYYNKGKWFINAGFGNSDMESEISQVYGTLNTSYKLYLSFICNVSLSYGFTEKTTAGINLGYFGSRYFPKPSSEKFSPGSLNILYTELIYRHCLWNWRYFYYGVNIGPSFWFADINKNIFSGLRSNPSQIQPDLSLVLGGHFMITKNVAIHADMVAGVPNYVQAGISYIFK